MVEMGEGRILVACDDAPVLDSVMTILRSEGYDVRAADDPHDAARLLTSFGPQVLVVNFSSTAPTAVDLFELRRALGIPLLMVASPRQPMAIDADKLLNFPVLVDEFLTAIRRLLEKKAPASSLLVVKDRRSPSRPRRGDMRPCHRCGGMMYFEEADRTAPAWMCRNVACLNAEFVRGR